MCLAVPLRYMRICACHILSGCRIDVMSCREMRVCSSVLQCVADQLEVYCIAAAVHVRIRMSRME